MKFKATLVDPLYIAGAIYLGTTEHRAWFLIVPIVVASWLFNPRWSRETGWRFLHDE